MVKKDFQKWHKRKTEIEYNEDSRLFFHEREIWWCSMGVNIGYEQDGKGEEFARPVLIFKKFNNELFWGLPISTKIKVSKFYSPILIKDGVDRVAILSQMRPMDGKRLLDKIETINKENYFEIQKAVISLCC